MKAVMPYSGKCVIDIVIFSKVYIGTYLYVFMYVI